ncbi:GATA transcription factor-like protein [Medicago truncatula]|uniref:GATA transcription factor-like protein n=1 Tax=Medicago truncatula TaxID=3880 RepID=A0A072UDG5_MEDTR|nr:GATA transcription factor-like protein [Medicago truncatula]
MGKQGPCHHCGVTSTPLWRNGPPEKPILCNACGSRWRTKGTLANYTPLHARAETDDFDDQKASRMKSISLNKNKEVNLLKRKQNHYNVVSGGLASDYNQGFHKAFDEDMSNRSSSGSALSNSESCAQFGGTDASDLTGPSQSVVWDTTPTVPSKKRTCVGRAKQPSSVEKLTKDLCTILHEQQSCFSESSDGDLLYESEAPMVSVEIGHGSVLIRHPSYVARDEESEASSLSFDNGLYPMSDAYSYSGAVLKSDKSQLERVQILGNHDSPLCLVDLNDVVNYEEFTRNLSYEEQQQLLKFLPVVDTAKLPDGLKVMFSSSQFKENLTNFQQLLAKGAFDISLPEVKPEDCETLKRYALNELSKSKWVEHYHNKVYDFLILIL